MPIKFRAGKNCIVYGLSGNGKTTFIQRVLKEKLVSDFPPTVYYFYKLKQPWMEEWTTPKIHFIEGLELDKITPNSLVVIDDLSQSKHNRTCELFLVGSHHQNISVFYLTQNLYPRDESCRLMTLNAHYLVLFTDMRSARQIKTLAHQLFDGADKDRLINALRKSINTPYSFILLTFVQDIPREITVLTDYWSETPSVFI